MELRNISKRYGEKLLFSHFSRVIPDGASLGVMGPSGAGKTTLLRLILGLEKPDEGELISVPEEKSALFQEDRLFPKLSAVKNISLAAPRCQQARELLAALGLGACMEQMVCTLSGGQARRVALARALAKEGKLLALDEPFTGLDEESRLQAAAAIRRYRRGRTLILVSHRQEDLALLDILERLDLGGK